MMLAIERLSWHLRSVLLLVLFATTTLGCSGQLGVEPDQEIIQTPVPSDRMETDTQTADPAESIAEVTVKASDEAPSVEAVDEGNTPVDLEGWTSFRNGPQQLGIAHTTLPDELELLWEYEAPDGVTASPAISQGRVYAGIVGGNVFCLDLKTGELIWSYRSIESADPDEFAPGFQAPVTITDELVLCGDEDGVMHAIDRETGDKRWVFPTGGEVVGGMTIVGEHGIFGSHGGKLYRLNLSDGSVVWEFETRGPVNASPTVGENFTFVTGCDQPIMRVVDIGSGEQHSEVPLDGLLIATPALVGDVLYFGTDSGTVYAIDWQAKQTVWSYTDPNRQFEIRSSPAVIDDLVIIGSRDKHVHAINRLSGEEVWSFATRAGIDCSPVVCGDRVYFGSRDKNVYGLTIADGQEVWKQNVRQSITASPAVGEGHLVIGTDESDGRILCFGASE
ncbi:MAG: PQQ-binding-like beta-propeller repeat protein [Planctomycetaceae bacterium]